MICTFFKETEADSLLIFFNGWGMDTARMLPWTTGEADVLSVHDYTELGKLPERVYRYQTIHVVAWSLGVWAAHQVLLRTRETGPLPLQAVVAVNGTLSPISSETGIPPEVFRGTGDHWLDAGAREKFYRRMGCPEGMPLNREPLSQQCELRSLERQITDAGTLDNLFFTRAVIGTRDRIFFPGMQRAAWQQFSAVDVVERVVMHDAFAGIHAWNEVLQ